jgi:outer membrane receptor protein involved in Fe transport
MGNRYILFIFAALWPLCGWAQTSSIKGTVTNIKTGDALPFASLKVNKTNAITADSLGHYEIFVEPGKINITVTLVGYEQLERTVHIGFEENRVVSLELVPKENQLDQIVVSGSRQEVKIASEVMSITSVKPYLIANTNAKTLTDVLNNVPGVSVVDGQAMIRGGTGWSYNVGSRVMVLLDGMPLMGPDVGDVQWDLLPIEAAENIEVIKGPSSALYGSSASAGTVNVITGWPTNKPETKVTFFQGVLENPKNKNSIWWERTAQPFNTGSFFVHKQKFGQFDVVASANVYANRSFIQMNDEYKARAYIKTRYRFKKIKGLSTGINGEYMVKKAGRFFLWQNADSGALKPFDGSIGYDRFNIYSIDQHTTYLQRTYTISLKYRFYNVTRNGFFGANEQHDTSLVNDTTRVNDAVARIHAIDFSFQKRFLKYFSSISGLYATSFNAIGNVYPGKHAGYSGAAYTQLEFAKGRWNTVAGLRYEINVLGPIEQTQRPLLRFGLNYRPLSKTFLRLTYGEGFRFPTIVERYVEDNTGSLRIFPNPDLKTERGWYTEIGVRQGFSVGGFTAMADACFFWMEYDNLIQLRYAQYETATYYFDSQGIHFVGEDKIGFKAINTPKSRTAGYEVSLEGSGNIGQISIRTLMGYTYSYPVDLTDDPDLKKVGNYMRSFTQNYGFIKPTDSAFASLVPYRNRHLVKMDIEFGYKKISLGYNTQYMSVYEKMDNTLYYAVPDLPAFQDAAGKGTWVHNIRMAFRLTQQFTLAFLVNNVANTAYATRPARLEPMRSYNIQMRLVF